MEYKNKKFVIFPDAKTDLERRLRVVTLPHPSVNTLCEYLYDSNHDEVYEIQEMTERSDGVTPSAFFGNECISQLELCGAMAIDRFFFLLSALAFARSKQFVDKKLPQVVSYYINNLKLELEQSDFALFDKSESNIREMFQKFLSDAKLLERIEMVCDVSREEEPPGGGNQSAKLTLNDEKLLGYFSDRIIKAAKIASERNLVFKEYYNESKAISPQASLSLVPAQEIAYDLLAACIPRALSNIKERLRRRFGELKIRDEPEGVDGNEFPPKKHTGSQYIGVRKGINKRNPPIIAKPSTYSKKAPYNRSSRPHTLNNGMQNGDILYFLRKK